MAKNKIACALSAAAVCGALVPLNVFAYTDVTDVITYNDGANNLSTLEKTFENGVTSLNVRVRFDGASLEKILNQSSGKGSTPGRYYATIDPKYGFTKPFAKGNYNYTPGVDEPDTPEDFEAGFAAQLEECSEYYMAHYGIACDTWAYWESNSSPFWQDYGYIQYKKDGNWIDATSDTVNFGKVADASQVRSNGERLVAALGLESADDLQYGVNWRFLGDETATAWIYRDTYPNSTRDEYIKIHTTVEYVFDYMTLDENNNPIYHATLEDALTSDDDTIILNKDTEVDTVNIPVGKTLIEREGELTVNDLANSSIKGVYSKQDGERYYIAEVDGGFGLLNDAQLEERDLEYDEEEQRVMPKRVDWGPDGKWYIEDGGDEEGHVSTAVEFGKELIADRKATLSATEKGVGGLILDENKGGEMLGAVEIEMLNRGGGRIEVKNNELVVYFDIDEETHTKLAAYDKLYVVYFEDGVESERYEAYLSDPDEEGYWFSFKTSHLSTYGVVGVNEEEVVVEAEAPETGTVTAAGASASAAALVTAAAVGVLTAITSFAYLVRRKG